MQVVFITGSLLHPSQGDEYPPTFT